MYSGIGVAVGVEVAGTTVEATMVWGTAVAATIDTDAAAGAGGTGVGAAIVTGATAFAVGAAIAGFITGAEVAVTTTSAMTSTGSSTFLINLGLSGSGKGVGFLSWAKLVSTVASIFTLLGTVSDEHARIRDPIAITIKNVP